MTEKPEKKASDDSLQLDSDLMKLRSCLADLEHDMTDLRLQKMFMTKLRAVLRALPQDEYAGSIPGPNENFSFVYSRIMRRRIIRENEYGLGDIVIRRMIAEWKATGNGRILDQVDTVLPKKVWTRIPSLEAWRRALGQRHTIWFSWETLTKYKVARTEHDITEYERAFDNRKASQIKRLLGEKGVRKLVGKKLVARYAVADKCYRFEGALREGDKRRQRRRLRKLAETQERLRDGKCMADNPEELMEKISREFGKAVVFSESEIVWRKGIKHLKQFGYDPQKAAAVFDNPEQRITFLNRLYPLERNERTARNPLFYVGNYGPLFSGYRLRFVNTRVGFVADSDHRCLFTPGLGHGAAEPQRTNDRKPRNIRKTRKGPANHTDGRE